MTVCIAAACEGGKKIVSATDGLLTLGGITADVLLAKMTWFGDWLFLYAGATSNVGLILEELRQLLVREPEMITREHIQEAVLRAYRGFIAKASSSPTLAPFGISLEEFAKRGLKMFGDAVFSQMHSEITARSRYFEDQILTLGWGAAEASTMIYGVHPGALTTSDDLTGVTAIGSGADVALATLLSLGQSRDSSLAETLFNVAVSKFSSEKSQGMGVGLRTAIYVSWKRTEQDEKGKPAGKFLPSEHLNEFRRLWEAYVKPKMPDEARVEATRIAGQLIGTISARDLVGSMQAAMRMNPNRSGAEECVSRAEQSTPESPKDDSQSPPPSPESPGGSGES